MIGYTVYFHAVSDQSSRTEEFAAFYDVTAELYVERFSGNGPLELWRGNWLVKRWSGENGKLPEPGSADVLSPM